MFGYTPEHDIIEKHRVLRATFSAGKTLPLAFRRRQLLQVARMFQDNAEAIFQAVEADLGRPRQETALAEIGPVIGAAVMAAEKLPEWAAPAKPEIAEAWRAGWDTTIFEAPKGLGLIIGPWNYPWVTTMLPLVGAIAAGCAAVVKPSEYAPACGALMRDMFAKYLDPEAYTVVLGGVPETTKVLSLDRWDHIFFTGSTHVGKIILAAAAKHVTPCTMELGGCCPVFVDAASTDIEVASRRILWGKQNNAGQICVAPNCVYVLKEHQDALVAALRKVAGEFFPAGALDASVKVGRAVNRQHYDRLQGLLAQTKGTVVIGGKSDEKNLRLEPTVVKDVKVDDVLVTDEIFGAILAIVPVESQQEALANIARETPLVTYIFTEDDAVKQDFLHNTRSGQIIFNETFGQLAVYDMPLSGFGSSGYGSYMGKYSYDTFIHKRSSINVPIAADPHLAFRYQPYSDQALAALSAPITMPIPEE